MEAREMKTKLFEMFQQSQIESSLKAQLRLQLIQMVKKHTNAESEGEEKDLNLNRRVINSLLVDFFKSSKFSCSLSIFLPESGMSPTGLLSHEDIIKVLNIEPSSKLFRLLNPSQGDNEEKNGKSLNGNSQSLNGEKSTSNPSLLETILGALKELEPAKLEKDVQTDSPKPTLDMRLHILDEELQLRSETERLAPLRNMEERLLKFQRESEERHRKDLEKHMEQFRETELARVRSEEKRKLQDSNEAWISEQEKKYSERYEKLKQREEESVHKIQERNREMTREDYDQRQKFLQDLEIFREKEREVFRERELNTKELQIHKNDLLNRENQFNKDLFAFNERMKQWEREKDELIRSKNEATYQHELEKKRAAQEAANISGEERKHYEEEVERLRRDLTDERESNIKSRQEVVHRRDEVRIILIYMMILTVFQAMEEGEGRFSVKLRETDQ